MADQSTITKEQIEAHKQQRVKACSEKLSALLKEYECNLVGVPQFTPDGRIVVSVQLVAS